MKKLLVVALAAMSCTVFAKPSSYPTDLTGKYACNSIEVGTKQLYTGTMTMRRTGETYSSECMFNDGSTYSGTAIYNPKTHQLSVAFVNPKDPNEAGVAMVDVQKDYGMRSVWTYLNKTTVGSGTCKKIS